MVDVATASRIYDILTHYPVISWNLEVARLVGKVYYGTALTFDRHLDCTAADTSVTFHSDRRILKTNLATLRVCDILRHEMECGNGRLWIACCLWGQVTQPGAHFTTWITIHHSVSNYIHYNIWDEITYPFPLKIGNGSVISSHT